MINSPERLAWSNRAVDRARAVLKAGDKLTVERCGGRRVTVAFVGWDGRWICTRALCDIGAVNVVKLNGKPVDFTNGEPRPA